MDALTPEQKEMLATLLIAMEQFMVVMNGVAHYLANLEEPDGDEYKAGFRAGVAEVALNMKGIIKTLAAVNGNTTLH